jgi:hypothetical protein
VTEQAADEETAAAAAESPGARLGAESPERIREQLHALVLPSAEAGEREDWAAAPEVAPGLREFYALELPEGVGTLSADGAARLGTPEELRAVTRRNLAALPVERHDVVEVGEEGAEVGTFHLLSGNSLFTSSRVLVLDDLVRQLTGAPIPSQGAVVGIPSGQQLVVHPVAGSVAALVVATMTSFVDRQFARTSGGLSPHLYWWRAGELTQLTEATADGGTELSAELSPDFLALVDTSEAAPAAG